MASAKSCVWFRKMLADFHEAGNDKDIGLSNSPHGASWEKYAKGLWEAILPKVIWAPTVCQPSLMHTPFNDLLND